MDEYLADDVPPGPTRDRVRQLMSAMIEQDDVGQWEEISARWALTEDMFVGDVVDDAPVDGHRSGMAPLAAGIRLRLDSPVRRIEQTASSVIVGGDGWSETGSYVVVTGRSAFWGERDAGLRHCPPGGRRRGGRGASGLRRR